MNVDRQTTSSGAAAREQRPWTALVAALVVGIVAGLAVGGLGSATAAAAGGVVALVAGTVYLVMIRAELSTTRAGAGGVAAAALAGALLAAVAVRGDGEQVASVAGTGVMSAVLGVACVLVVHLFAVERD
jgi:hypothetical protein